jgi:hypothetical protein
VLNPTPFLQVTLLKLVTLFPFQTQTGVTQGAVHFDFYPLTVNFFPFAQNFPFLRAHLYPALGVSSKYLSIFRRHRDPSIARIVQIGRVPWRRRHPATMLALASLRLRLDRFSANNQNRGRRDCAYNV